MDLLFFGLTFGVLGKVLLGIAVVNVHGHVIKEKHIDKDVIWAMKREKWVAISGVVFMILGYFLEIIHRGYLTLF